LPHDPGQPRTRRAGPAGAQGLRQARRRSRADRYGRYLPSLPLRGRDRRGGARVHAAPAGDLDATRHPQRRGGKARRGERPQGGDEPLPEDRIWAPVVGDRLDGRQHPHSHRQEGSALRTRHPAHGAQPRHARGRRHRRGGARGKARPLVRTNLLAELLACASTSTRGLDAPRRFDKSTSGSADRPVPAGRGPAMTDRIPGLASLGSHAGAQPDPATGARATPIYQTTSFVFEDVDHAASLFGLQTFGNIYTRIGNPPNAVLEERVAALEGGTAGLAVASGHAAQVIVMHCLMRPGDEFVAAKKLYGGSINQFNHAFKNFCLNVVWAEPDDLAPFERAVSPKTKAIFIESIANPGGVITDIEAIGKIAKNAGVPLIVDNTLATPYLCKPIDYGADIVVHSLTKFL